MLLPPKRGSRRPQFSSLDDKFWTTPDGEIPYDPVEPRNSIWTSFKNMKRLGRKPRHGRG